MPQVKLTLKTDEKDLARPDEMRATLRALLDAGLLPATGITISYTVAREEDAETLEETITAAIEARPWVIDAEIEIKSKRGIPRRSTVEKSKPIATLTPMDEALASMA